MNTCNSSALDRIRQVFYNDCESFSLRSTIFPIWLWEDDCWCYSEMTGWLTAWIWCVCVCFQCVDPCMWSSWQISVLFLYRRGRGSCCFNYKTQSLIYRLQEYSEPFLHKEIIHFEHWIYLSSLTSNFVSLSAISS